MACIDCKFYEDKSRQCRRFPPRAKERSSKSLMEIDEEIKYSSTHDTRLPDEYYKSLSHGNFPTCAPDDWCGEFSSDDTF